METSGEIFVRDLDPGMGRGVARRTVFRKADDSQWGNVARRVAKGNFSLIDKVPEEAVDDERLLEAYIARGGLLMSGRHLQHGDENQSTRNIEVMTNCFDGSTLVATIEHGPVRFDQIVGQTVTVKALDGVWRPALVSAHGRRPLNKVTFVPSTGNGLANEVIVTPDHRWVLKDGSVTEALKEGDVLALPLAQEEQEIEGVQHGLIFGDGSNHKRRVDHGSNLSVQGREYPAIRLCGADKKYLPYFEGMVVTYPEHAQGDPVVYLGRKSHLKDLPFTNDPAYLRGFLQGWWMADGAKGLPNSIIEISTIRADAVEWLKTHAAYLGVVVTSCLVHERTSGDGSFENGKPLFSVRLRVASMKVKSVQPAGEAETFCLEEPVTSGFYLANGIPTGNCSTAAVSFGKFYLLLNGSGVGRSYDDVMMAVDWSKAPDLHLALNPEHPDFPKTDADFARMANEWQWLGESTFEGALQRARQVAAELASNHAHWATFGNDPDCFCYDVEDSREGWGKGLEIYEGIAHARTRQSNSFCRDRKAPLARYKGLYLDFSSNRGLGSPIGGMQDRPASGPMSPIRGLWNIVQKVVKVKDMPRWQQSLTVDHYTSAEVQVGGARRAARMATKSWRDKDILKFIRIKSQGGLWSANHSVVTDEEFWKRVYGGDRKAKRIFKEVINCSYVNGEPGFINGDKLDVAMDKVAPRSPDEIDFGNDRFRASWGIDLLKELQKRAKACRFQYIVNPCGEIVLHILGAYCVIADVVPVFAMPVAIKDLVAARQLAYISGLDLPPDLSKEWDARVLESLAVAARALIRVNSMPALYGKEVRRTNRIGVGLTGLHEYAWLRFGVTFEDMAVPYEEAPEHAKAFWDFLAVMSEHTKTAANRYAAHIGVGAPHTVVTMKPAGTTSKLFGLTEGAHLPAMAAYLRWVQYRGVKIDGKWSDDADPLLAHYEALGYPVKEVGKDYAGVSIVGFPTVPLVSKIGMPVVVVADEATPDAQYNYLRNLERFWIGEKQGNQVSYTMKVFTNVYSEAEYGEIVKKNQPTIRCCSIMPTKPAEEMGYAYLPEQRMPLDELQKIVDGITDQAFLQDIDLDSLKCASGACPI